MKKENIKYLILQIFVIVFFLIILLTSKVLLNKILIAIFLCIYALTTKKVIARPKQLSIYKKEVTKYMTIFAVIYLVLYYVLGMYVGYYKSPYVFGFKVVFDYVIPLILIIISSEIIRNEFLSSKNKLIRINTLIFAVVVDLVVYVNIYNLTDLSEFLQALGYIFFASIVSNILYNYTSEKFSIMPNIIYRIITTIYVYLIPIVPNVYIYFKSVARMVYPLIIYLLLKSVYEKNKTIVKASSQNVKIISTTITVIIMAIIAALISCKFKYGVLVIGSGSMTGTIDKGDAVLYESSNNIKDVNEGDIILFNVGTKIVIHRVVKIEDINDEIRLYTKGDNNLQQDPGYITQSDYRGHVRLKIKSIGLPTVWINDFFKRVKRG